jgi:hypothetical protein
LLTISTKWAYYRREINRVLKESSFECTGFEGIRERHKAMCRNYSRGVKFEDNNRKNPKSRSAKNHRTLYVWNLLTIVNPNP